MYIQKRIDSNLIDTELPSTLAALTSAVAPAIVEVVSANLSGVTYRSLMTGNRSIIQAIV